MRFPEVPQDLSTLSDEELNELHDELVAAFNEATDETATPTDDEIAELATVADNVERLRSEQGTRTEAAQARADQVAQLASRVNAEDEPEGDEPEGDEPKGDGEPTGDEPQGDEPQGDQPTGDEPAPQGQPGGDANGGTPAGGQAGGSTVAAGATLGQMQRRAPARTRPRAQAPNEVSIIASGDIPGVSAGQQVADLGRVAELLVEKGRALRPGVNEDNVPVVQFRMNAPEDRYLSSQMSGDEVMRRIEKFDRTPEGIQAAGGLCAPVNNYYNQMVIAEAARPVRDALANFTADRGGIRFNPPPTMAAITSGVGTVTAAQDLAGGGPATKSCFTVTCPSITEVDVTAVYNCLQFGNFGARAFPEQVEAWTKLALAVQARTAETMLLDGIAAGSTTVTTAGLVGAGREILARLGQAAAGYRSRNRMLPQTPLRVLLPAWVLDLVRSDLARTLDGPDDVFAVADAQINTWLSARNLNVSWYIDSKTGGGQIFGAAQGGQTYTDAATTSGSATLTSSTAAFTAADVGKTITGAGIPASTTISAVGSATSITLSANATATATGVTIVVGRTTLGQFPSTVYSYMFAEGTWLHLDAGTLDLGLVRDSTLNSTNQFRMFTESFEQVAKIGPESLEIVMSLQPTGSYAAAVSVPSPLNT